jgi:hypothetical protein
MVGHKKNAIEEKSLLYTLELLLHFSTNARAISADDWQKRFHHKDPNVKRALSRVVKYQREAGAMFYNFVVLCSD